MPRVQAPLGQVLWEWGRIGCIGFGGPPAHVALLREVCVERRGWLDAQEFEDANAACALLPGPASTQLAIFCAQRVAGLRGAVVGGLAFILPGLVAVLALAALTLQEGPPDWIRGAAAGAGAAVVAVVVQAGVALVRSGVVGLGGARLARTMTYLVLSAAVTVVAGAMVVVALLACGLIELAVRRLPGPRGRSAGLSLHATPAALALAVTGASALPALAWTSLKVGALSYGGGFVIVPLMQHDAVAVNQWMTNTEFLNAVALGQLTPGPVTQTIGAVGYAAAGLGGGLLASAVAFLPSFLIVALGGRRFEALRADPRARAFLDGAGPAAIGAIFGAAVSLLDGVDEIWQMVVLALAGGLVLTERLGTVAVLMLAAAVGTAVAAGGGPLP
jgi:chromate transporter